MRLWKLPDIVSAAGFGAGRWLVLFGLSLMLVMPAMRLATSYVMRGDLSPAPLATPQARTGDVAVIGGTTDDEQLIRAALAEIPLRFDPASVNVRVVPDLQGCEQCAAAYLPEMREILLPESTVRAGGPMLRWALAHEMGHYVDTRYLNEELRERYADARDIPDDVSWMATDRPWQNRPTEDFAEVFAVLVQPTVERPIGTVYGRIEDRDEIEAILAAAKLRTGRPVTSPWGEAVAGHARYLAETFRDPLRLLALQVIALTMGVFGAWKGAMLRIGTATTVPSPRYMP